MLLSSISIHRIFTSYYFVLAPSTSSMDFGNREQTEGNTYRTAIVGQFGGEGGGGIDISNASQVQQIASLEHAKKKRFGQNWTVKTRTDFVLNLWPAMLLRHLSLNLVNKVKQSPKAKIAQFVEM